MSERPAECGVHAPLLRLRDMAAARVQAEALQLALAPGITGGTDPRRNMGMGLKLLSSSGSAPAMRRWCGAARPSANA